MITGIIILLCWLALGKLGCYLLMGIYRREVAPRHRYDEDKGMPWWFYLIMPLFLPFAIWDYYYPESYRRYISSEKYRDGL